jgi:hypothetical protein
VEETTGQLGSDEALNGVLCPLGAEISTNAVDHGHMLDLGLAHEVTKSSSEERTFEADRLRATTGYGSERQLRGNEIGTAKVSSGSEAALASLFG